MKAFTAACIDSLSRIGGEEVPRPFGPAVHREKPNDLIKYDYIEIAPGPNAQKYVPMLRDDHSYYTWFLPTGDTSAEQTEAAIIDWCTTFGVSKMRMSDR